MWTNRGGAALPFGSDPRTGSSAGIGIATQAPHHELAIVDISITYHVICEFLAGTCRSGRLLSALEVTSRPAPRGWTASQARSTTHPGAIENPQAPSCTRPDGESVGPVAPRRGPRSATHSTVAGTRAQDTPAFGGPVDQELPFASSQTRASLGRSPPRESPTFPRSSQGPRRGSYNSCYTTSPQRTSHGSTPSTAPSVPLAGLPTLLYTTDYAIRDLSESDTQ
jgi:hypothetical protein